MQHDDNDMVEQEEPFDLARFDEPPASIAFGDEGSPVVELSIYDGLKNELGNRIEIDAEQRSAVSNLLSQTPALIQSGYLLGAPLYRVTFPAGAGGPTLASGGGWRAIARDGQGKIVANGKLHPVNGLKTVAAVTAVWQVMAIVTAQVHLSEINARLANIERGIDEIRALLEADQVSKIEMGVRYVRGAATALGRRDLSEPERVRIADQLEHIWRDCGQVARTVLLLLNRAPGELATLPLSAWYRLGESADLAREAIAVFERRAHAYLMAEYVRCATIALRTQLELNTGISEDRLDELRGDLADWRDSVKAFFILVNQRVKRDLSATFYKQTTIDAERRRLIVDARKSEQRLIGLCEDIERMSAQVRTRVQAQRSETIGPMTLIVTLDERGQIAETYHIPDSSQEHAMKSTRGKA